MRRCYLQLHYLSYAGLFVLFAIAPIKADLIEISFTLLFMLIILIIYTVFLRASKLLSTHPIKIQRRTNYFSLALLALSLSIYASYFYTGSLFQGYMNLILGVSNYNTYQSHFASSNLSQFSISKIPAILSLLLVKCYFYFSVYCLMINGRSFKHIFCTFVSLLALVHFSIARGTSFEIFEVLLFSIFTYFIYYGAHNRRVPLLLIVKISVLIIGSILIYNYNISLRYAETGRSIPTPGCSTSLCYDNGSFIAIYFPALAKLLFMLAGYFSFGFVYLGKFHSFVIEYTPEALFLPIRFIDLRMYPSFLCNNGSINCGVMWTPSLEKRLLTFSYFGFFVFIFILGKVSAFVLRCSCSEHRFTQHMVLYFHFLMIFSLSVGNLFSISSNLIMYTLSLLVIIGRQQFKIKECTL